MKTKLKKPVKYFLIFMAVVVGFLVIWFLIKPLRAAKASDYLNSGTLIGYQKAAILTPLSPLVYLKIGQVYENQGNFQEAEREFRKILWLCRNFAWKNKELRACPEYKEGYFNLRKIKTQRALEEGDLKQAEASLAEALELNSSDPEIGFYWGIILTSQGNYEIAIENLKSKIENVELEKQREILLSALSKIPNIPSIPSNPYYSFLTGASFLKMGCENLAILQFEKAAELEPDYRDAWVYLGKTYLQRSDYSKAKESLEKAVEIDPIYPETFYLLSKTYEKLKKPDEAQKALEKAKMLGWRE